MKECPKTERIWISINSFYFLIIPLLYSSYTYNKFQPYLISFFWETITQFVTKTTFKCCLRFVVVLKHLYKRLCRLEREKFTGKYSISIFAFHILIFYWIHRNLFSYLRTKKNTNDSQFCYYSANIILTHLICLCSDN